MSMLHNFSVVTLHIGLAVELLTRLIVMTLSGEPTLQELKEMWLFRALFKCSSGWYLTLGKMGRDKNVANIFSSFEGCPHVCPSVGWFDRWFIRVFLITIELCVKVYF